MVALSGVRLQTAANLVADDRAALICHRCCWTENHIALNVLLKYERMPFQSAPYMQHGVSQPSCFFLLIALFFWGFLKYFLLI